MKKQLSASSFAFAIEDEMHAELVSRPASRADALAELRRLALVPWGSAPNQPPCAGSATCRRAYELVQYVDTTTPWSERSRTLMLEVDASGARWLDSPGGSIDSAGHG